MPRETACWTQTYDETRIIPGLTVTATHPVLPGVHFNVSFSGVVVSVGGRGFHAGITARGQRYVSAGLPGTGLSMRQYGPVNSTPKLSFWPVVIAVAVLALLSAIAVR